MGIRFTNIKFHTMKFVLLSTLFLGFIIQGILTFPFEPHHPDCGTLKNCQSVSGCNSETPGIYSPRGRIGECIPYQILGLPRTCLCDKEYPVQDCWDNNKCILDKHCGENGKCILRRFRGFCQCNVSEKKCMSHKDCISRQYSCVKGKCVPNGG